MPLPDQTPPLPKLPFLVGDAALLAAAWYIAGHARHPLPIGQTLAIVGCVASAAVVGAIPFLTEYARRQDAALDERQRELEALARTVASSGEQISIAAQGLQEIAAQAQRNLKETVELPRRLVDFQRTDAVRSEKQKGDKELGVVLAAKTERLEAVAEQIAKGAADWSRAEAAFHKMVATFEQLPARVLAEEKADRPAAVAAAAPLPEAGAKPAEPPTWASEPEPLPASPPADLPVETAIAPTEGVATTAPAAAPKPPRKPRKPKVMAEPVPALDPVPAADLVDDPVAVPPAPAATAEPEPAFEAAASAPEPSDFAQVSPEEAAPAPAVSSDGATRLLVTAYIGIGNRLFIRGDGPGLNWDKGVPLQFVSIGKWRWETSEAAAPIKFRLYKNDEIECKNLAESVLEPARQHELSAAF
jgi:hypothetical protein